MEYEFNKSENWEVLDGDALDLRFEENYFDAVVSITTFEHISNLNLALRNVKGVLKPYGKFYTEFSTIWTSIIGHHYEFWKEDEINLIPPWAHLLMDSNEMLDYLKNEKPEEEAKRICFEIYNSDKINRSTMKEIIMSVVESGMFIKGIHEFATFYGKCISGSKESELTDEIIRKLKPQYSKDNLGVVGFRFLLEKYCEL